MNIGNCSSLSEIQKKYIMNLNQITVPSLDLAKSIPFYEKLGLKLIVKSLPHYARFECPNGNSTFSLHQTDKLPEGGGVFVYFECENLDEHVKNLKQKGFEFELEPTDQRWLWREARLKDLDKNQLILYYAGDDRLNPPWRIDNQPNR
jgi:catechol 2,3-dioxygenase-like lactoylglutathione lyase family enzyme